MLNSRVSPRRLLHRPLATFLLKEKTNSGALNETGLRITVRESKCGHQDWSLASPFPLGAQNQFHGSPRPYINLGAGTYARVTCPPGVNELLFEGKSFLEDAKPQLDRVMLLTPERCPRDWKLGCG